MDYPSKIAFRFGIPLDQFMRQNTAYIKDLETSLTGVQVLCCNPANGECTTLLLPMYRCSLPYHVHAAIVLCGDAIANIYS